MIWPCNNKPAASQFGAKLKFHFRGCRASPAPPSSMLPAHVLMTCFDFDFLSSRELNTELGGGGQSAKA
eukprot:3746652-Karenia_brevis.AAC.1